MYRRSIGLVSLLGFLVSPTFGLGCDFCSAVAFINEQRGACFQEQFADRMTRLEKSGRGFVQVDLDACISTEDSRDDTRAVGNLPLPSEDTGKIIVSREQMCAVKAFIEENKGALEPGTTIDLRTVQGSLTNCIVE